MESFKDERYLYVVVPHSKILGEGGSFGDFSELSMMYQIKSSRIIYYPYD